MLLLHCTVVIYSGTSGTHTYRPVVPDTHTAVVTHTPRPCNVTGRQKRVSSNPRLFFFVSAVQLYCVPLCKLYTHGGRVCCWWVDGAIAVHSCTAVVSSNPRLCFYLFLLYSCTVYCCAIVHAWWVGGLLVGGWCYCCTAVLLLHCPAVTLARRRPLAQSIAPSIAAPSITRRHRRQGVHRWAAVVDRPPSPDRSLARSPARPPSLARRRRRRSGGLWPPSSLARRRPLARSPAVVRSFARRRSFARPPSFARRLTCYY